MKRSTLALAVAGVFAVPGLAQAQSTVQVYGNVRIIAIQTDTGVAGNPSRFKVDNPGGTRIGFKGTENLGGGLTAWWQIEQNAGPDAGGGVFGTRNTGVGLTGGWGTVLGGRWDSAYKTAIIRNQPFGATTPWGQVIIVGNGDITGAAPAAAGLAAAGGTAVAAFERRLDNTVQYWTPRMGGFQGYFSYQAPEARTAALKPQLWSVMGEYRQGPISVNLAYEKHEDFIVANRSDNGVYLAARYRSGPIEVGAGWERLKYEPTATTDLKRDSWHIDGQYRTGPHRIGASYAKAGNSKGSYISPVRPGVAGALAPVGAISPVQAGGGETGADQIVLLYGYSLSKRTEVTLAWARLDNDIAGVYSNRQTPYGTAGLAGNNMKVWGVGLWHTF